ncbi:putative U11/U12 small nuclear ribonucleoprotein 25kDa protein [Helianthus annuus]|nr:putative U11/U12 small nuclear ribonucleoprotein 25kDa protein [Helianthus annuus]
MTELTPVGVIEDDNVALEYNCNNVKKEKLNSTLAALLDDHVLADVPKKPTLSHVDRFETCCREKVNEIEQSKMGHRHISCAIFKNNEKLLNDAAVLQDHGLRNHSQGEFYPILMSRTSKRHSRRRKHRFFHGLFKRRFFHCNCS